MLPVELSCQQDVSHAAIVLRVDRQLFWFRGHFPVQPVLPGVAQLSWVMHYGVTRLASGYGFRAIEQVKFQQPVLPDTTLTLSLTWQAESCHLLFDYSRVYESNMSRVSSGKILLC